MSAIGIPGMMGGAGPQQQDAMASPTSTGKKTDSEFEKSLADLAMSYLQDKAPRLVQYMIGFQILDKDEEGTRAAAVFGFKVGKKELFTPLFFLNGELKGLELLYIKSEDLFIPFAEDWVDYIVNQRPHVLGEADTFTPNSRPRQPDLSSYWDSPMRATKYAGFHPKSIAKMASGMFRKPDLQLDLSLEKFASRIPAKYFVHFLKELRKSAEASEAVAKFYPPERLKKIAESMPSEEISRPSYPNEKGVDRHSVVDGQKKVTVIDSMDDPQAVFLDEDEKENLVRRKITIIDRRGDEETTTPYLYEHPRHLFNPDSTGIYEVLVQSGEFKPLLVVCNPIHDKRKEGSRGRAIIIQLDGKKWATSFITSIWARKKSSDEAFRKWYDSLEDSQSLEPMREGDIRAVSPEYHAPPSNPGEPSIDEMRERMPFYLLINEFGVGTVPFSVERRVDNDNSITTYNVAFSGWGSYTDLGNDDYVNRLEHEKAYSRGRHASDSEWPDTYSQHSRTIMIGSEAARYPQRLGLNWIFPKNFKAMKVGWAGDRFLDVVPGDLADMEMGVSKMANQSGYATSRGSVSKARGRYVWKLEDTESGPEDEARAVRTAVKRIGMREKKALELLDLADKAKGKPVEFILLIPGMSKKSSIKQAIPFLTGQGPVSPGFPPMASGYDVGTGVEALYPQTDYQKIPTSVPIPGMNEQDYARIVHAGNSGQHQVMDVALLGNLVQTMEAPDLVDKYIRDLTVGLDRLGRILFLYYWHNDKFEDRYGPEEMAQLEDSLKNVFKGTGDLVLFLRQKSIMPNEMTDISLENVA